MVAIVDREARRVLFDLLHVTYHFIRVYKAAQIHEIVDMVADKCYNLSNQINVISTRDT